jgi:hypothetical protein
MMKISEIDKFQTFRGTVKTATGSLQPVFVQAYTQDIARSMLKAMYGDRLQSSVIKVK